MIDELFGIQVKIPARSWSVQSRSITQKPKPVTDSTVEFLIRAMKGKKIRAFEIAEMPPATIKEPLSFFLESRYALCVVKLKYVDIRLLNEICTLYPNITSFTYESACNKILPRGPSAILLTGTSYKPAPLPATLRPLMELLGTIKVHFKLTRLRELNLKIKQMSFVLKSDWANIAYFLLASPSVLPGLRKFVFDFQPKMKLNWKTQLLVVSFVAEFLTRTPNLKVFNYKSDFQDEDENDGEVFLWLEICRLLIRRFGSDQLKGIGEMATGDVTVPTFMRFLNASMRTVARSLKKLEKLTFNLSNSREHELFTSFVSFVDSANLSSVKIKDLAQPIEEPDINRVVNLQTSFLPSSNMNIRPIPAYRTVSQLHVESMYTDFDTTLCLRRLLESMPLLKSLQLKQEGDMTESGTFIPVMDGDPAVYSRLERLEFENVVFEKPMSKILAHCVNLKQLKIVSSDWIASLLAGSVVAPEFWMTLYKLRKLEEVHIEPVFCRGGLEQFHDEVLPENREFIHEMDQFPDPMGQVLADLVDILQIRIV